MYHPFQDRSYMLMMAILKRGLEKVLWGRDLVRMSVTWCLVLMDINLIAPDWTLSWTKWQSISICLVHWWKVWLLDSNLIIAVDGHGCCRWGVEVLKELWESNEFTDGVGECAMFFSIEDRETTGCFLAFHEIGESPRNMQNPMKDHRVFKQAPQSEFEKACRLVIPWLRVDLR